MVNTTFIPWFLTRNKKDRAILKSLLQQHGYTEETLHPGVQQIALVAESTLHIAPCFQSFCEKPCTDIPFDAYATWKVLQNKETFPFIIEKVRKMGQLQHNDTVSFVCSGTFLGKTETAFITVDPKNPSKMILGTVGSDYSFKKTDKTFQLFYRA